MIKTVRDLRNYVAADARSMGVRISARSIILDPIFRFTVLMRMLEYAVNSNASWWIRLPIMIYFRSLSLKLGFSLAPNIFGPGLAIVHHGLLIIDPTTRIGKNCRIHMGVHLGGAAKFVEPSTVSEYSPRIGDNVYIGPGAKIYGPVKIGDNCTVGANAVVTKSFPQAGLTLAGVPAKVIAEGGNGERVIKGAG